MGPFTNGLVLLNRLVHLVVPLNSSESRRFLARNADSVTSFSIRKLASSAVVGCWRSKTEKSSFERLRGSLVGFTDESVSDAVAPAGEENQTRVLPDELSRSVVVLSCDSAAEGGICHVYLVGTCHISKKSAREVQQAINFLKPQVVFLELCRSRKGIFQSPYPKVPTMGEMVDMWKKKRHPISIVFHWVYAQLAAEFGVYPGLEFRVAFEEAKKYGIKVILGDRPINITLRRTWEKMPCWHKAKLFYSLIFPSAPLQSHGGIKKMLKELDDIDTTHAIEEVVKKFPTLAEAIIHERDQYMASELLRVASEHSSVVAVVGKGHLPGIQNHWKKPVEIAKLLEIPPQKPTISAGKILCIAVVGVGVYLSCNM